MKAILYSAAVCAMSCALGNPAMAQQIASPPAGATRGADDCKNPHFYQFWKDRCTPPASPPATAQTSTPSTGDWKLGDVVSIKMTSFAEAKVKPPSAQLFYGRLKFHFANGARFGDLLNDKQSWWSRFRPTSSAISISVAATASDAQGSRALLPTTILRSYEKPLAQSSANAQTLVQQDDAVTPWIRLDPSTKLAFDLKVDSASAAKLQVLEQTIGQAAKVYGSLNPGKTNIVGKLSATAIDAAATQMDSLLQTIFDPDSDKHRILGADQLYFTPVAGDRQLVEITFTDDQHAGQSYGVLQVSVEFARSITDTAALPSPNPYPAGTKLDPNTRVSAVKVAATSSSTLAIEQLDKYSLYLQQLHAASLSPQNATDICQSLAVTASDDWNLTPLDTARLVLETDQSAFDNQVDAGVRKALDTSKCLNAARRNILSQVGLGFNSPSPTQPTILPPDLEALGHKIAFGNDPTKENFAAAKLGENVSFNYALSNSPFSGSFDYPQDQVVDALKSLGPTAYCCINGDRTNGRVTLLILLAAGPAALDFSTGSAYDTHINVIDIRDATAEELKKAPASWGLKAPSTKMATSGAPQSRAAAN
jgi:hypothetical protein